MNNISRIGEWDGVFHSPWRKTQCYTAWVSGSVVGWAETEEEAQALYDKHKFSRERSAAAPVLKLVASEGETDTLKLEQEYDDA